MLGKRRRHMSRRNRTTRLIVLAVVLCSGLSCLAPVLYASTDCSRWVAEYRQGILQRRAAHRLHAAKYRLTSLVRPAAPVHKRPLRHSMGPLEALRRFQIDCGDVDEAMTPAGPVLPSLPVFPKPLDVSFPEVAPPELPAPADTEVAEVVPPLTTVPAVPPFDSGVSLPGPVPEPSSLVLVLTGALVMGESVRRRTRGVAAVSIT